MMKIEIEKYTNSICKYRIIRSDLSISTIELDAKTYFMHDMCHFVVEKNIQYKNGFWGMLSQGNCFADLMGKENPKTEELRLIEQIVGPVQSAYCGHIPVQDFYEYIQHIHFNFPEEILKRCLEEIKTIMDTWHSLPLHGKMTLLWQISIVGNQTMKKT